MKKPFKKWEREKRLIVVNSIISIIILLFGISFVYVMDDFLGPQYGPRISEQDPESRDSNLVEDPEGCTNENACNYDPDAIIDDGSCEYYLYSYLGDLNFSGDIDVLDIVQLADAYLTGGASFYIQEGDMNEDGIINVLDIVLIVNLILSENPEENYIPYQIDTSPSLDSFMPNNESSDVELVTYLNWISESTDFDVYFGETVTPGIVESGYSEDSYDPELEGGRLYSWRIVAKADNCGETDSGVLYFSTITTTEDPEYGEGEVIVEVTGTFDWEFNIEDGIPYDNYVFGLIERGQSVSTAEINEGRGIEMVNLGTQAVTLKINYTNFLFDDPDSTWNYLSRCIAINETSGEIKDYISGVGGCVGEFIQLDPMALLPEQQNLTTCLKYTSLENEYKPGISLDQEIFISYTESLGQKIGTINVIAEATDEDTYCTESPFDEFTIEG